MIVTSFPPSRPTLTHAGIVVSAPQGYRPLQLDLHVPPGDGPFPVVLWLHGGEWQGGSRVWWPEAVAACGFHERTIARGYAIAEVDYRLAFEAQYPAQLVDVQDAIRWLRHFADRLRLDPSRFAAIGESAGGQLGSVAALLGTGDTALQAMINWYGAFDLSSGPLTDPFFGPAVLLGGPIGDRLEFARSASPVHLAHAGAPPFLNIHGTDDSDVPFEQAEQMTEALHAYGVRADLLPVPGADHCFVGCDDIGALVDAGLDFLDDVLAR